MTDLHVSWDEYNRLVERLALIVHDSGWQFDAIICLARGGLRVGDALSRIFDKPLGVMTTSSYRASGGTQQGHLKIGDQVSSAEDVTHGRILLADDLVDTGVTLQRVLPELRRRHPAISELRTAVLWYKGVSVCSRSTRAAISNSCADNCADNCTKACANPVPRRSHRWPGRTCRLADR